MRINCSSMGFILKKNIIPWKLEEQWNKIPIENFGSKHFKFGNSLISGHLKYLYIVNVPVGIYLSLFLFVCFFRFCDARWFQLSLNHGLHLVPVAVWSTVRCSCKSPAALQTPFFTVVSERAVRLQMETSGEQPYSARRLLLQQGQETSRHVGNVETREQWSMVSCQKCLADIPGCCQRT